MTKYTLQSVATKYIQIIEQIEKTTDKQKLIQIEEERVIWHNHLLKLLRQSGIEITDRFHATQIAYDIVKWNRKE